VATLTPGGFALRFEDGGGHGHLLSARPRHHNEPALVEGQRLSYGYTLVDPALEEGTVAPAYRAALEAFRDGEKHVRLSPAARAQCALFARGTEEQIALLAAQSALDAELDEKSVVLPGGGAGEARTADASSGSGGSSSSGGGLVDSSLAETLFRLLLAGEAAWSKRADKLAKDFRVGEAQYAFLRIRAFAQLRDWAGLWAMANERKSPVGYRPFAEACILGGSNMEAKRYVMLKMTEYGERLEVLALLGPTGLPESIELARAQKDLAKLEELAELAVTPQTRDAVEKAIAAVAR
jgi:hypothetical protein